MWCFSRLFKVSVLRWLPVNLVLWWLSLVLMRMQSKQLLLAVRDSNASFVTYWVASIFNWGQWVIVHWQLSAVVWDFKDLYGIKIWTIVLILVYALDYQCMINWMQHSWLDFYCIWCDFLVGFCCHLLVLDVTAFAQALQNTSKKNDGNPPSSDKGQLWLSLLDKFKPFSE